MPGESSSETENPYGRMHVTEPVRATIPVQNGARLGSVYSDNFCPGSASGRASIALRRPAKAKPVSCWLKLAAEVCSRCSHQLCWFACGNDNTNASYCLLTKTSPQSELEPGLLAQESSDFPPELSAS